MNLINIILCIIIAYAVSFVVGVLLGKLILFIIDKIKSPKYDLWVEYQPNPMGKNTFDCSIRAISKIFSVTWGEALDLIVASAKKYSEQTNCSTNLNTLLYEKQHMHVYEPKKKITFETFAHLHPIGTYALYSKGHICACIDGKLYDSWNSSRNKVIQYCAHMANKIEQDKDITFDCESKAAHNMWFDD